MMCQFAPSNVSESMNEPVNDPYSPTLMHQSAAVQEIAFSSE